MTAAAGSAVLIESYPGTHRWRGFLHTDGWNDAIVFGNSDPNGMTLERRTAAVERSKVADRVIAIVQPVEERR